VEVTALRSFDGSISLETEDLMTRSNVVCAIELKDWF